MAVVLSSPGACFYRGPSKEHSTSPQVVDSSECTAWPGPASALRGPSSASLVVGDSEYHLGEAMQGTFKSFWKMDSEDKFILVQESFEIHENI